MFEEKFAKIVKRYKDGLAHKSLQMVVVGATKQQLSGFQKKKVPKFLKPQLNLLMVN